MRLTESELAELEARAERGLLLPAMRRLVEEVRALTIERDDLIDAGDTLARAVSIGLQDVRDCQEGCTHPACHILRARARWRRVAVAVLARQTGAPEDGR